MVPVSQWPARSSFSKTARSSDATGGPYNKGATLHFELCYYQGIDFAIERGFKLFEAGAQGEHKLARGFLPSLTYSAHKIRDPAFRACYRGIHRVREGDARVFHARVRLPRSLQTLSRPATLARYYTDTPVWRALLRGGCSAWSSWGLSGRGTVGLRGEALRLRPYWCLRYGG